MIIGPTLTTARLILRPPSNADFPALARMLNGFSVFSVLERESGRWIGRIGPWRPEGWPSGEVAWTLVREAWGKGYATEAATAALDFVFETLGWPDVIHAIVRANIASIRLAERVGSRHIGPVELPPPFENMGGHAWGQTREEWRSRRRATP